MARLLVLVLLTVWLLIPTPARAEFCTDLQAKYGTAIVRCFDFATADDAKMNWTDDITGVVGVSTHRFNAAATATPGATGSFTHKIRSYNQVKAEDGLDNGASWFRALKSGTGLWQRWAGTNFVAGKTYYIQYKFRFNDAWKKWHGGGAPKMGFGFDVGCRKDVRDPTGMTWIPTNCDSTLNLPGQSTPANRVTGLGTASSVEWGVGATSNWFSMGTNKPNRPLPVFYQGSSNFNLTRGYHPRMGTPLGTASILQPGPDANGPWDGATVTKTCDSLARLENFDFVEDGRCVTYGAPDVWHEVVYMFRPAGTYYTYRRSSITNAVGTPIQITAPTHSFFTGQLVRISGVQGNTAANGDYTVTVQGPSAFTLDGTTSNGTFMAGGGIAVPAAEADFKHQTLFKIWYDGKLIVNLDPAERPFKKGQISKEACAAIQNPSQDGYPLYDLCRTGVDMLRDRADLPFYNPITLQPCPAGQSSNQCAAAGYTAGAGSNFPVYPAPWIPGDPGADPSQINIGSNSFRRGWPSNIRITGATNATPIVITTGRPHNLAVGDPVQIANVGGNTAANGHFTVASVPTTTTFALSGSTGNGTYTGSGFVDWFCPKVVGVGAQQYGDCHANAGNGPSANISDPDDPSEDNPARFDIAFVTHPEVNIDFDDIVISTEPLPMQRRADYNERTITAATNATPIVVTTDTPHGFSTGTVVTFRSAAGNTAVNGLRRIKALSTTTFSLHDPTTGAAIAGNGTYSGSAGRAGTQVNYGLDVRDIKDMVPPNTFARLHPGPDRTWLNTKPGTIPTPYFLHAGQFADTKGIAILDCTNRMQHIPVELGAPLPSGGFQAVWFGHGEPDQVGATPVRGLHFGGAHAGHAANSIATFDGGGGRWAQSSYIPDMGCQIAGAALGGTAPTPPGIGCPIYPLTVKFTTTANITSGSNIITNVTNIAALSQQANLLPGHALANTIAGIPAGALIQNVDVGAGTITMTDALGDPVNATATTTGVTISGGNPNCTTGGTPNGSTGGRGWWEHISDRGSWDPTVRQWVMWQNSGTWLYRDTQASDLRVTNASNATPIAVTTEVAHGLTTGQSVTIVGVLGNINANGARAVTVTGDTTFTLDGSSGNGTFNAATSNAFVTETWKRITSQSMPCDGNRDYLAMSLEYNPDMDAMLAWCASYSIYKLDRGTGAPDFTGAAWVKIHTVSPDPSGSSFSQMVYDSGAKKMLYFRPRTGAPADPDGNLHPRLHWFDPLASPSCVSNPFPCGQSGAVDMTGGPTSRVPTLAPCVGVICETSFGSLAYDSVRNESFVLGRRAGDAQIIMWGLKDPGLPTERWTRYESFNFNVYHNSGLLKVHQGDSPLQQGDVMSTGFMQHYFPDTNVHLIVLRGSGGGNALGGNTRSIAECGLNDLLDDCFDMYAFTFGDATSTGRWREKLRLQVQ